MTALQTPAAASPESPHDGAAKPPSGGPRPGTTYGAAALAGGVALALWAQSLVVHGAGGADALLAFGAAGALFLSGLLATADTDLLRRGSARPVASSSGPCAVVQPGSDAAVRGEQRPTPVHRRGALTGWRRGARRRRPQPDTARSGARAVSARLLVAALALGVVTFATTGGHGSTRLTELDVFQLCQQSRLPGSDNHFTWLNVSAWAGSVALALLAGWQRTPRRGSPRPAFGAAWRAVRARMAPGLALHVPWTGVALAATLVCGAGLLFYRIGDVPREMTSDHAEKLLDVQTILDGQRPVFFPCNTGREAAQFYLIALMTPLAGTSYLTMKLGTAFIAWFTLPFSFLLTRLCFGSHVALLATAILATSRWLLQVARVGLRFPFPPAFGAATFYFLLRALRYRRRNDFLLCGLVLGLAQHTYTALRFAPLAVLTCVGVTLLADLRRGDDAARWRALVADTALLFLVAGLVFMPLARYAYDQPQVFLYRGLSRVASDSLHGTPSNVAAVFLGNVKNAFLMFNWRGDVVWVNNIPGERLLDPVSGALCALGALYIVYRVVRFRELPYVYLALLLCCGLLPSILSLAYPAENPSTVRSGMAIPVVAILVALPLALLVRTLRRALPGPAGVVAPAATLAGLCAAICVINFDQYFHVYPRQHERASQHTAYVAAAIDGFLAMGGRREDVHVVPWAGWIDWRLVAIQVGDIRWRPVMQRLEDAPRQDGVPRERLYVVYPEDREALAQFAAWYPGAIRHDFRLAAGGQPWFVTMLVPPGAVATPSVATNS